MALLEFGVPDRRGPSFAWRDLAIAEAREDRPVTRHVHLGLVAPSREVVDEFWETLTADGFLDDGAPGPREKYRAGYYGSFVLDPDGNSIEAVHKDDMRTDGGSIDHVWVRVRDVAASKQFYEEVGPALGYRLTFDGPTFAYFRGATGGLAITTSDETWSTERPLTENLHLAFPAEAQAVVDAFHAAAVAAGYRDSGVPKERGDHTGSYSACVLDPDGNNVEAVITEGR